MQEVLLCWSWYCTGSGTVQEVVLGKNKLVCKQTLIDVPMYGYLPTRTYLLITYFPGGVMAVSGGSPSSEEGTYRTVPSPPCWLV